MVDEIFNEIPAGKNHSPMLELAAIEQASPYKIVQAEFIKNAIIPETTHEIKKP